MNSSRAGILKAGRPFFQPRLHDVADIGDERGAVVCGAQSFGEGDVLDEERMPAETLVPGLLEAGVGGNDASACAKLATGGHGGHGFG